ncbi:hypothetical protein [Roseicyclus mahoneyensis]|uniref:Uncharacterized protein n=1 Tax=Roseicyclus mahoneyensis TaxID=164332 RepID=A0A316GPU2_9RHOB|nr:hypothetical protein [Roseicyclus mahoneyensis]PWK62739.1 hypothetical protein C7455_101771 [Roseicyclus mahoneyensis]
MRFLVLALACIATPAAAQETRPVTLDPAAVLALAAEPWRDRAGFVARLEAVLGPVTLDQPDLPETLHGDDPFLWSLTGRFGAPLPGSTVAGGIIACARYGLATRDRLSGTAFSDREVFALFAATQPANDDAVAWPETGLARLACMITWDDTRRVAIIPEAAARGAVFALFASVTRDDDASLRGGAPAGHAPIYGAEGYRLEGRGGLETSVMRLDRGLIELQLSHQVIRFRSYLLNGGM